MPLEQTQLFCDEKQTTLTKCDTGNKTADTIGSVPTPKLAETRFHYELKNVNISLPKINIPNEVLMKHEVEKYRILFQSKPQTARKSFSVKTVSCAEECVQPCKSERTEEESVNMSAKILNFSCLKCQDSTQYSPNDLQKHFEMRHHGELPSFPCEMCSFSANDFQIFKQHRKTHRSTFVKCDICNSERSYTLLELTKHFTSKHCVNGNFQCEECRFFTQDVGTFVQHIHRHKEMHYKCGKCRHLCFTKGELQKHLCVHSGTLPFTCHYCSYGAIHKDQLVRHVITLHKEHLYAKEKLEKDQYDTRVATTTTGLKLILKRYKIGPTKTFWKRKTVTNGNDESMGKTAHTFNIVNKTQTKSEDQSQEQLNEEKGERLHCENDDKPTESEKSTLLSPGQYNKADEGANANSSSLKSGVQGPTVLLVRNNKITIPANYSAKFMGFKVVDGRQHIVIKLLPINKPNLPAPALQPNTEKDSTANLPPQALNSAGFATGVTTEVNDTDFVKAAPLSSSSPVLSRKEISEKEMAFTSEKNNMLQTVDNSKSLSLPTTSEPVAASVSLTTKVEARDNVDSWENHTTQSHPDALDTTTIKSPDKVNLTTKPNAYSCGDMHNYCINYVSSELPDESSSYFEFSNQGSLPFHNYSKVNYKHHRFSRTGGFENLPRDSSSETTQDSASDSDSLSPLMKKESSNSGSPLASVSPLNDKDGTFKTKTEIEEPYNLEERHNFDKQSLFTDENQNLLNVTEETKWNDIPSAGSPMMPRITSVFSLQSQQASEFLPPEVNQLLQDVLKPKSDIKENSDNITSKNLLLNCDQTFKKAREEEMVVESSKDFQVQDIFPVASPSVGVSVPTNDLNLKCNGQETQVVSVLQDVRNSEVAAKIPSIVTLLKTQSDAIITQQLVKDKLRTTAQNSGPVYIQNPFLTSEQRNPVFVQTPKGFLIPLQVANKRGFHVFSGRPLPLINKQSAPASLLVNKKPGVLLTLNKGKPEGVHTVKTENVPSYGTVTTEPCKTPFLKVEANNNFLTPTLCSGGGSCVSMKSCSANVSPLKGPYIIKTSVASSVRPVHFPNILPEQQGPKMNILDTGKQQNETLPKASLYTLMPDGKQAVFLKCMMPNNIEPLKPKLVRSSPYQHIQPKRPEGAPQKILVKIFNPVLNVSAANNLSVSNSEPSFQKENVPSKLLGLGEQKEPESSRNALPVLVNDLMPANGIVHASTAACAESSEEPACISEHSETRVLRYKANCTNERNFNKRKTCKNKFAKIKTRISQDSETTVVSRNRSCKRKYIDNYQEPPRKKSTLHRKCREKANADDVQETFAFSRPRLSKDSGRTLRLFPFNSKQLVKCPRRNQPVVVLNHPDADAPEVERVMKTIAKFNGRVLKVSLSQTTINALLKPVHCNTSETTYSDFSKRHKMLKPANSVKERFVLKLTLKKTSKNNYQIVKTTSEDVLKTKFNCWFCGRVFDNQDMWAGHGQRHLVEATRDWNMLE